MLITLGFVLAEVIHFITAAPPTAAISRVVVSCVTEIAEDAELFSGAWVAKASFGAGDSISGCPPLSRASAGA